MPEPEKLNASIAMVNVPSDNPERTKEFYAKFLGIGLIPSLEDANSFHTAISEDGVDLFVGPRRHSGDMTMAYFHVDDLDASLRDLTAAGGRAVWGPETVSMSAEAFRAYEEVYREAERGGPAPTPEVCRAAVVLEAGGSLLGLMQIAEHMHDHYQVGANQKPLGDAQLADLKRRQEVAAKV